MCIVATVCIIGADTNLNNISVTHIAVRYFFYCSKAHSF